jgi:sporulation protein YlmC with PRC-barrel domain
MKKEKEIWISYIDDLGQVVSGFFILIEENLSFVKIKSGSNILTIPFHKINKIKEAIEK